MTAQTRSAGAKLPVGRVNAIGRYSATREDLLLRTPKLGPPAGQRPSRLLADMGRAARIHASGVLGGNFACSASTSYVRQNFWPVDIPVSRSLRSCYRPNGETDAPSGHCIDKVIQVSNVIRGEGLRSAYHRPGGRLGLRPDQHEFGESRPWGFLDLPAQNAANLALHGCMCGSLYKRAKQVESKSE